MFKLGDYYTRFYSSVGNRSRYGSIWRVTRVLRIRKDTRIALKEYHKPSDHTEISIHPEIFLIGRIFFRFYKKKVPLMKFFVILIQ